MATLCEFKSRLGHQHYPILFSKTEVREIVSDILKGSYLCGDIQFEYKGTPFSQKFGRGPFGSFIGLKNENLKYIKDELKYLNCTHFKSEKSLKIST